MRHYHVFALVKTNSDAKTIQIRLVTGQWRSPWI